MKSAFMLMDPKLRLKSILLNAANVERIHIFGCSRSGTTMLAYTLLAFENTILFDKETNPHTAPGVKETIQLWQKRDDKKKFYITKRNAGWYKPTFLQTAVKYIKAYNVFLLNIIRDPRDVLSSKHPLSKNEFYVHTDMWLNSFKATEYLEKMLRDYPNKLTIRYEDLIINHKEIERQLNQRPGMKLNPNLDGINRLKDSVEVNAVSQNMVKYMHKLRNFDTASIGSWRTDKTKLHHLQTMKEDAALSTRIEEFMARYGYGDFNVSKDSPSQTNPKSPLISA